MFNKYVIAKGALNCYLKRAEEQNVSKYRIVSEELAVAAVAVLPVLLVGGRGGAGAPLRAAIFILPLLQLRRRVAQRPISHFVPLTCLVPSNHQKAFAF